MACSIVAVILVLVSTSFAVKPEDMVSVTLNEIQDKPIIINGNDTYLPATVGEDTNTRSAGKNALMEVDGIMKFLISYMEICNQLGVPSIPGNLKILPNCTYLTDDSVPHNATAVLQFNAYLLPLQTDKAPHKGYPVVKFQSNFWLLVFRNPAQTLSWTVVDGLLKYTDPYCRLEPQTIYIPWGPFLVANVTSSS